MITYLHTGTTHTVLTAGEQLERLALAKRLGREGKPFLALKVLTDNTFCPHEDMETSLCHDCGALYD